MVVLNMDERSILIKEEENLETEEETLAKSICIFGIFSLLVFDIILVCALIILFAKGC